MPYQLPVEIKRRDRSMKNDSRREDAYYKAHEGNGADIMIRFASRITGLASEFWTGMKFAQAAKVARLAQRKSRQLPTSRQAAE